MPRGVHRPDVVVLFGDGRQLAEDLVGFLKSIRCEASIVNPLPGDGKTIATKVAHYIMGAKLVIGIATKDVKLKHNKWQPKQSLIPELTLSLQHKRADTLLLLERGTDLPVTLEPIAHEEFGSGRFHCVYPGLIEQLQRRRLIAIQHRRTSRAGEEHQASNKFIEQMNHVWNAMDEAWDMVYRKAARVEASTAEDRDEFFVAYYNGFDAILFKPQPTREAALEAAIEKAERIARGVFRSVLEWKAEVAGDEEGAYRTKGRLTQKRKAQLEEARRTHQAFKAATSFRTARDTFQKAMKAYNVFIS